MDQVETKMPIRELLPKRLDNGSSGKDREK